MTTFIKPITASVVERVLRAEYDAGDFVRDPTLLGFGIRIGAKRSGFIAEARIGKGGRSARIKLGTVGQLKLDDAKIAARDKLNAMAKGVDVTAEHRKAIAETKRSSATWADALQLAKEQRTRKASTLEDYQRALIDADLEQRRLRELRADDLVRIYRKLKQGACASRTLRILRALWNLARAEDSRLPAFPSEALKKTNKSWSRTRRSKRVIFDAELPDWWQAVQALPREEVRDLVAFMLYTGCRVGETRKLTADDVNLRAGVMVFRDTKTRKNVELPIVQQLVPVLKRRLAQKHADGTLFPRGRSYNSWQTTRSVALWSPHDLRRMYISSCHRIGMDETIARALTGHANQDDAHSGYVTLPPDALREHAQAVADSI